LRHATGLVKDFDYGILDDTAHRPWPMPAAPWIMTQTWHDMLFAHWPVDPAVIRALVPPALDVDLFEDRAWLGIVPFRMTNVAPRGIPAVPWLSAFPELNVRTYVRVDSKPGVFFLSLDAANAIAVAAARALFGLPYYRASMSVRERDGFVRYRCRRMAASSPPAELAVTYHPTGAVFQPERGSREYFLTERYCLYIVDRKGRPHRLEIHHPPWPLQAAAATFDALTMTEQIGLALRRDQPLLHFARRQDVVAFPMTRV
jgi:uncharacterized protein YqjF (DUF2071 family)